MKLVLASGSPRRREILTKFGYEFSVKKSGFFENGEKGHALFVALNNAKGKAEDVYARINNKNDICDSAVIGADTVVCFNDAIIGKPKDVSDAVQTLKMLSDNTHKVITGFCVLSKHVKIYGYDESVVRFNSLSDNLINEYVSKCKPFDKAGSYGIQDGFPLVASFFGSLYNVIGFPIEKLKPVLDGILYKNY